MPQQASRAIGADVSDLMPPVGADVSSLMTQTSDETKTAPATTSWLDSAIEFAKGVSSQINPIEILHGLYSVATSPIEAGRQVGHAQRAQFTKAKDAYDKAQTAQGASRAAYYSEALGHTLAGALPLVGPAAAEIGEDLGAGNVAHGLGAATGLIGTVAAPGVARMARGAPVYEGLHEAAGASARVATQGMAASAERGATARMADVIAPKVGPNKLRFGRMADDVAPRLTSEPGLASSSRASLGRKVADKLSDAEAMLDEANDARNPAELIDTSLVTSGLEEKLRKLMAEPAEGPEAHAAAEKAGYTVPVPKTTPLAQQFGELPNVYQGELRRLSAELKEFQFVDRTWIDKSTEVAREGGFGTGRGARTRTMATAVADQRPFTEGAAGTPVYHEIMSGKSGTTRQGLIKALDTYIDKGTALPSSLVQRAINLADKRIRTPEAVSRPMLPLEDFLTPEQGALGKSVIPKPNLPRAQAIMQALQEVRELGPMAPYDSLRKIRQAWDIPAKARYAAAVTPDYMKVAGESYGAADVTGTLRDVLSFADPKTAAANKQYAFWRKANDVFEAADEVERTRPTVGRRIMARGVGAMAGGAVSHGLGELVGAIVGPMVDAAGASLSEGRRIMMSRTLADVAAALRSGDGVRIETALKKARAISVTLGPTGKAQ